MIKELNIHQGCKYVVWNCMYRYVHNCKKNFSHNHIFLNSCKTCRFFTIFNLFADFLLIRFQHFFLFFKRFIFFSLVKLYFIDKKGRLEWINSEIRGRHSLERRMSYQTFINVRQRGNRLTYYIQWMKDKIVICLLIEF